MLPNRKVTTSILCWYDNSVIEKMALRSDSGHRSTYWPPMMVMMVDCASSGVIVPSKKPENLRAHMSKPEVRARVDRRAAEARPGSAPVWDTRGGLVPGPDRDKQEQRKKREGGNWQGQQQRGWGSAYSLGAAAAVVNVEREARTVNPLEHLPKVRVP